ncbi:MAG: transcription-repair coupling factor [Thermoanaerobaculia bacterium]|nr:transcription-repair coupling factor [Thermoanaerobaculia bacterium]
MPRPAPWQALSERLGASSPFRALPALLERGAEVVRLPLPAAGWVLDLLAERTGRTALVLLPHEGDALALLEAAELTGGTAAHFPAPPLSPYHEGEPSLAVRAQEAVALDLAGSGRVRLLLATPRALFRRLPRPEALAAATRSLAPGERLDPGELARHLLEHGYRRVDLVSEVGELAVRGGVVDLFPPGEPGPVRLDLFGDEIESVRRFDAVSQRTVEELAAVRILPLAPFPEGPEAAAALADLLARLAGEDPGLEVAERLAALRGQGRFPGWEQALPLAAPATAGLADYLPPAAIAVAVDLPALLAEARQHAARLEAEYAVRAGERRLAIPPDLVETPLAEVEARLAASPLRLGALIGERGAGVDFGGSLSDLFHGQLPRFPREVETARARGERLLLVAPPERFGALEELLAGREVPVGAGGVELVEGELGRGFRLPAAGVVVFSESQLLARPAGAERRARARFGPFLSGMRDLKVGDYVVHTDHGIGQFVALRAVAGESGPELPASLRAARPAAAPAAETEVMEIAYAGGRRLLVPLSRLDQVQKYSGIEGVAPRLDQLGGSSWNRTKARVKRSLREMAGELLALYAERQLARAPAMGGETDLERQFAAAFPFEETADQLEAIGAILADLERETPMDRLLCGDVGFGKTEVAMRAAFRAVAAGWQVAVLAPTTILADQHLERFRERFAGFPLRVEMISRFRSAAEVREVRRQLAAGRVDILVGTHRLLSRDIEVPRLGLVIIDEEQRFGVAQKERLKQLKKNVHVLAMTATPLPRTLQMSLAGVRDLSVIETPPKDRMAVETAILPVSDELVREAVEVELERGGQVFFVHNRVESIDETARWLGELVPGARVTVGHGQLDEEELYRRMHAFTRGEFDVLVATTIIENGIDIPNVNTMLVHRADRFGLAQLYQLRGRVGRSSQLGYCYLLVAPDRALAGDARKRLEALREFTELGAGFRIAARDLEIRGAGNLLGAEQSGHIGELGIETYLKMLEETVRELRGEAVEEAPSVALDLPVPMAIPASYIAEANLRMEVYRRLALGEESEEDLVGELTDRFGPPPPEVGALLEIAGLKRLAERLRVQSISAQGERITFRLRRDARVDVDRLVRLVASRPGAAFSPTGVLTLETRSQPWLPLARGILEALQ